MTFLRSSIASFSALALAAASPAAASVRPSDSVVSAQQAASVTPVAQRQGARLEAANDMNPALLALIIAALLAAGFGVSKLLSQSP